MRTWKLEIPPRGLWKRTHSWFGDIKEPVEDLHALVFSDVPLRFSCVFIVELVDGTFSLGDGFSAFGLRCLVARFDFGGLFLAPVPV